MNEPDFLTREAVDLIHEASLRAFGGADGVRDENALESALAQPMHEFFYRQADLYQIAAAYAFHIAENQPYIDGNKRTGSMAALWLLAAILPEIEEPSPVQVRFLGELAVETASGGVTVDAVAFWLERIFAPGTTELG